MRQNKFEYDAFISHAVEDKIPIANELCAKLERAGLKIWYSGKELGIGDSIEKTIERGLNRSRYGIVIFSPTYLAKNWTIREFYTLLAKEIEEQKVILPVLYNITLDELKNKDLLMADRFAVNSDKGIDYVVDRLVKEIKKTHVAKKKEAWFSRMWFILMISLIANVTLLLKTTLFSDPQYSAIPSIAEERSELLAYPVQSPTLLGEMSGLLAKFNGCTCRHDRTGHPGYQTTVQSQMAPTRPANLSDVGMEAAREELALRQPKKITMAVVFQIQAADEPVPAVEHQMDDFVDAVSMEREGGHFITVMNRNVGHQENGHECTQEGHLGH